MSYRTLGTLALFSVVGVAAAAPFVSLFEKDALSYIKDVTIQRDGPTFGATPWVYGRVIIDEADSSSPNPQSYLTQVARLKALEDGVLNTNFLCVEVNEGLVPAPVPYSKFYAYGRAGYLVNLVRDPLLRDDRDAMAGLQLALWEVAYDDTNGNSDDLLADRFQLFSPTQFNATARNWANTFLAWSQGQAAGYYYYKSPTWRDQQGVAHQDLVSTVPSPAALLPFAAGLLASLRRRRH
ncbi:MAG: hypothetical protein N2109_13165 [Fimbriimonadales bacterium]|nr:hypothetical protein [Fimbriimonadales bacterium]